MSRGENSGVDRRQLLKWSAVGGVAGLAGCGGDGEDGEDGGDGGDGGDGEDGSMETPTPTEEGTPTATPEPEVGGSYNAGTTSEAVGLHPVGSLGDEATHNRIYVMYDAGAEINTDIEIEGRWFESWELSDDNQVVEYTLRDNLQWGMDYGQFTAEDYMYSIENLFTADWFTYQYSYLFSIDDEPISFERTGDLSLRAELPSPRPAWKHTDPMMFVIPVPKELLQEYVPGEGGENEGDTEAFQQDERLTQNRIQGNLGPYSFEQWERNSRMVLTRNEDYYLREHVEEYSEAPWFDEEVFQVFDEASTGYSALRAGDINSMSIEARQVPNFEGEEGITLWQSEFGEGIFWLNINHRINGWAPLRESRQVRQALAHIWDKNVLIDQIFQGNANPVDTFHPRWGPYYDDEQITTFETDVEAAKRKLELGTSSDYGYSGDQFVGPDGNQVTLKTIYRAGSESNQIQANYLEQQLGKVGIAMETDATEWSNLIRNYVLPRASNVEGVEEPDWQGGYYNGGPWDQAAGAEEWDFMIGLGFSHGAYSPWSVLRSTLSERGSFNLWGYHTDDYNIRDATNQAAGAETQEEATQILQDLFGFLSREQPLLWSFNDHTILGYTEDVGGLPPVENAFSEPDSGRELYFKTM